LNFPGEGNSAVKLGEILVAQGLVSPADVDEAVQRQKVMAEHPMWTIKSDRVEWAREELKGRRTVVEARYAEELAALDAELEELQTLERAAGAFVAKHFPEGAPPDAPDKPKLSTDNSIPALSRPEE
jgi:hypothetical protein